MRALLILIPLAFALGIVTLVLGRDERADAAATPAPSTETQGSRGEVVPAQPRPGARGATPVLPTEAALPAEDSEARPREALETQPRPRPCASRWSAPSSTRTANPSREPA